jgi:hypothetical protein
MPSEEFEVLRHRGRKKIQRPAEAFRLRPLLNWKPLLS